MSDEDEVEAFEISDYDLHDALNPGHRKRMSKNQQTYGIWAAREDSDEDSYYSKKKSKQDYTAPVSFVSGGVKHGDHISKTGEGQSDEDEEADYQSVMASLADRPGRKMTNQTAEIAGLRRGTGAFTDSRRFGDFERFTKGFGRKMLNKYGYEHGKGLGKAGQGIVEPVQAAVRKGRGAVGAYGPEVARPKNEVKDDVDQDDDQKEVETFESGNWKKDKKKKPLKFRTMQQLISEGPTSGTSRVGSQMLASASSKVIDMTGKEQKVYTGYNAFGSRTKKAEELIDEPAPNKSFNIPELVYNVDLLIDMTEEEIIRNDRQIRFLKDKNVALEHEEKELSSKTEMDKAELTRLEQLICLLDEFGLKSKESELSLSDCSTLLETLQKDYYEEYKLYDLKNVAYGTLFPLLRKWFEDWQPLEDPNRGREVFEKWRPLLEESRDTGTVPLRPEDMDAYHKLIWEVCIPGIRRCVTESWQPTNPIGLINFLECWKGVLPLWILNHLLEQFILPKLQEAVAIWNPCSDPVPIHTWLHPWLPLLSDRLQILYGPIRQKLAKALNSGPGGWHPEDKSAKRILQPWVGVFTQGALEGFLSANILPRLQLCMQTWPINPSHQDMKPWYWFIDWLDMINHNLLAQVLIESFFPKWHKALHTWISCPNPNFTEISTWYSGWKSTFPQLLLNIPAIKEQFHNGLIVMSRAAEGNWAPEGAREEVAFLSASERMKEQQRQQRQMELLASKSTSGLATTFKDLVDKRAQTDGIEYVPVPNKYREGKQVYKFGKESIYIDRNVIFVQEQQNGDAYQPQIWKPIGLDDLVIRVNS